MIESAAATHLSDFHCPPDALLPGYCVLYGHRFFWHSRSRSRARAFTSAAAACAQGASGAGLSPFESNVATVSISRSRLDSFWRDAYAGLETKLTLFQSRGRGWIRFGLPITTYPLTITEVSISR